jgi:hypothetical protein
MNKIIILFEIALLIFFTRIVIVDWNQNAVTRDYFSLLIIGEIGLELYTRLREKTKKK